MKRRNRVVFFNILSTVLLRGISIFTAPLFSRLLGDSGYGGLQMYNIWTSAAAIIFPLQTQGTLVNARVEYPEEEQQRYQSSVMTLSVLSFLICAAVVLIFIRPVSAFFEMEYFLIYLMLLQAFGTFCVSFLSTKFTYEFKAGRNMMISLGITIFSLIQALVLVLRLPKEINYYGRVVANASTYALVGIPACVYILAKGKSFVNRKYWKFCLLLAIPTVFYNLSDLILGQIDRVMLQKMLSEAAVGQYSLALNFGGIMFTIFGALNNSWCPFFFEDMKLGNARALKERSDNYLELYTVLSVGFILLTEEVYHVFASQEFWTGTSLIPIFVSSYYINFLCTFPVNYEYYYKKTKVVAVITIASSLSNMVLNYILIQRLGIGGAAVATFFSHCLQLLMHYVYCRYILKKGDYPFGLGRWLGYALAYFAVVALTGLIQLPWLVRWGLGALVGLWELWRIKKRKVLI